MTSTDYLFEYKNQQIAALQKRVQVLENHLQEAKALMSDLLEHEAAIKFEFNKPIEGEDLLVN